MVGIEVDLCPKCNGLWCDGNELQKIVETKLTPISAQHLKGLHSNDKNPKASALSEKKTRPCVICHAPMVELNYSYSSGIEIDRCAHGHGVWLDHSEVEKVQAFAEHWQKTAPEFAAQNLALLHKAQGQMKTYDQRMRAAEDSAVSRTWFGGAATKLLRMFGL